MIRLPIRRTAKAATARPSGDSVHIAFDAQWFSSGPPSGCAVVRSLLPELIAVRPTTDRFTILVRRGEHLQDLVDIVGDRLRVVEVPSFTVLGTNLLAVPLVLRNSDVDVLVSQNFSPPWGAFSTVTLIYDAIHLRRPELFSRLERVYLSPLRPLARRASRLCTISDHERRELVRSGLANQDMVTVLPLAPRPAFLTTTAESIREARAAYGLPEHYILYLGRLTSRKNLTTLLHAVNACDSVTPNCPLILAGSSDRKREDIEHLMRGLGARSRAIGFVAEEYLPGLVAGASLLTFLSLDEGFGLPPLEAIACGTPALVSDLGVLREVLGDAAVYVDPLSIEAVAGELDRMLAHGYNTVAMREQRLRRAQEFTWAKAATALSAAIDLTNSSSGQAFTPR